MNLTKISTTLTTQVKVEIDRRKKFIKSGHWSESAGVTGEHFSSTVRRDSGWDWISDRLEPKSSSFHHEKNEGKKRKKNESLSLRVSLTGPQNAAALLLRLLLSFSSTAAVAAAEVLSSFFLCVSGIQFRSQKQVSYVLHFCECIYLHLNSSYSQLALNNP